MHGQYYFHLLKKKINRAKIPNTKRSLYTQNSSNDHFSVLHVHVITNVHHMYVYVCEYCKCIRITIYTPNYMDWNILSNTKFIIKYTQKTHRGTFMVDHVYYSIIIISWFIILISKVNSCVLWIITEYLCVCVFVFEWRFGALWSLITFLANFFSTFLDTFFLNAKWSMEFVAVNSRDNDDDDRYLLFSMPRVFLLLANNNNSKKNIPDDWRSTIEAKFVEHVSYTSMYVTIMDSFFVCHQHRLTMTAMSVMTYEHYVTILKPNIIPISHT